MQRTERLMQNLPRQSEDKTVVRFWEVNKLHRPFSYSAKEPGSSVIFIHFYTRDSIEWR